MAGKKVSLTVVIPTFNEEQRIHLSLNSVVGFLEKEEIDWEIIVVDNGSSDKTKETVKDLAKNEKRIKLLVSEFSGKGPAVRMGVTNASKEFVLVCDADLATPIKEFNRLFVWIREQGYDIAIASREGLGAFRKGEPYIRHLMGRVFNAVVQTIAISGFQDTQCGFKLFKTKIAQEIFGKMIVYRDFKKETAPFLGAYDVEVLLIAKLLNYKIKDIPVTWTYVPTKRISHLKDSVKMFRDVVKIRINAIKGNYK